MWRALAVAVCISCLSSFGVQAQSANDVLQLSPLRHAPTLQAGSEQNVDVTVRNVSAQPITVTLSVENFSVADYSYDYLFQEQSPAWLTVSQPSLILTPGESKDIPSILAVPDTAKPGGYYFTITARTTIQSGGIVSNLQAASLVYATVEGTLIKTIEVQDLDAPSLVLGTRIASTLRIKNTGNVHYPLLLTGSTSPKLIGGQQAELTTTLLPGKIRDIDLSTPAPFLPGIYTYSLAANIESAGTINSTKRFIYIPLWSITLLVLVVIASIYIIKNKRTKPSTDS